jgi:hypothetical protein
MVGRQPRPKLEDMTFDNYRSIISHGDSWQHFESIFGGNRARTTAKLKEIGALRNDVPLQARNHNEGSRNSRRSSKLAPKRESAVANCAGRNGPGGQPARFGAGHGIDTSAR